MLTSALVLLLLLLAQPSTAQPATDGCKDWQECLSQTTDALSRGEYEAAHDLAWRAMQKGPKRNPELLYLLARAQCLSGRPDDALVMLRRLAEMGIKVDAATDPDFRRTRELSGWPAVAALIEGAPAPPPAPTPAAAPASAPPPTPPAAKPPATPPTTEAPAAVAKPSPTPAVTPKTPPVSEPARFMLPRFAFGGLAYDAVSERFLFGDAYGRKLIVAREGLDHAVDYVRSESAGFYQVMSIEIDTRRGDLWVVSAEHDGGASALHKLQLISGRPLKTYQAPASLQPLKLVDLAVSPAGAIVALDAIGGRVLELKPRAEEMESIAEVKGPELTSITLGRGEEVAYVSHGDGITRLDMVSHKVTRLTAPKKIDLNGFERLRWHRDSLVGIQRASDGSRRAMRLKLNAAGRAVVEATVLQESLPTGDGPVFATVSGDELSFLVGDTSSPDPNDRTEVLVYRVPLK